MKIYYQGQKGAYMHQASIEVAKNLSIEVDEIVGLDSFYDCWEKLDNSILVLAIENSYAGSIHENLYNFLRYEAKIIGEYNLEINHALCSKEKNLKDIKLAYSHFKALPQCHNYLKKHNIKGVIYKDTSAAAQMVAESKEKNIASISSRLACDMFGLNVIEESIQDQEGNKTRFIIIVKKDSKIKYKNKSNRISILFEARDIPASLYKCLGAFATNSINLSKIESMPSLKGPFSYYFWLDLEGNLKQESVKKALEELKFFTNDIKILGEY